MALNEVPTSPRKFEATHKFSEMARRNLGEELQVPNRLMPVSRPERSESAAWQANEWNSWAQSFFALKGNRKHEVQFLFYLN